ncbi:SWIM zinc finger family protein [uncultured Nocardioides sp.]|uniref:SWIM zinc finger family protein n=1 Tax=uncultured Nocardioides sp. TaxID=198441 RepID=UPI00260B2738|nr:SWIM zinc finger family protein [uncultured Nocardioides sp.]
MTTVVHPRTPARRGAARATRWWAKAWVRAVEEASYSAADLSAARAISRSGRIGQISVRPGEFVAAVEDQRGLWAVQGTVPVLDPTAREALVETVAAEAGRVAALLAGELPHTLVEHAEEAGVELLPYGGELGSTCTCEAWADPCPHALAVLYQLAWLLDDDPFVLLHLRGLPREDLLAQLHRRTSTARAPADDDPDLDVAVDAALRAAALLAELDDPQDGDR